ncbi:Hsp20/alpha crystallin family protein [Patescibacteria group bacterium]|nr:Hsp20/alpha crystallin family protein [Patescibacteria group bacterium]
MTKQKKSFLDKIISSSDENEDVVENKSVEIETSSQNDEIENKPDYSKEVEAEIDEKYEMPTNETELNEKNDTQWLDKEHGGADEEGQLTVDVYKTKDSIVIKSIIGGVRSEDLDISVTSDMVTIKGKRNNIDEVSEEDYYYQECFWGNFSRSIILPCDIKAEGVEATIKNGILTLRLPKIEKNMSMKIEIKEE